MDREVPEGVRNREHNRKIIRYPSIGVAGIVVISVFISVMWAGVEKKGLVPSTAGKGMIEVSVGVSGKVVPAFEEIINSSINSCIIEVYRKGGDSAEIDTPTLKLDLQSTGTEYKKLLDEEQMRRYKLDQLHVDNQTKLSNMMMQIEVLAMELNRMKVESRNEYYLNSLGAGIADKVRQVKLGHNIAQLEYEQPQQQYKNEEEIAAAELKVQGLDFNIFCKGPVEVRRTLNDVQIRSPRKVTPTYISNRIGAQILQGGQVAIISDLSHLKAEGEIADTYGGRVVTEGKAVVKISGDKLGGTVNSVTPLSKNGVIPFTMQLKDDNNHRLRSGLKMDVYVMNAVKEDVVRMANASFYVGHGEYGLFVRTSNDELVERKVQLDNSSFKYVEVVSGLRLGDVVVVSDMGSYKNKNKLEMGQKRSKLDTYSYDNIDLFL